MSLPPREAWIEIGAGVVAGDVSKSLPPREAWIEIVSLIAIHWQAAVASPAGSVD